MNEETLEETMHAALWKRGAGASVHKSEKAKAEKSPLQLSPTSTWVRKDPDEPMSRPGGQGHPGGKAPWFQFPYLYNRGHVYAKTAERTRWLAQNKSWQIVREGWVLFHFPFKMFKYFDQEAN